MNKGRPKHHFLSLSMADFLCRFSKSPLKKLFHLQLQASQHPPPMQLMPEEATQVTQASDCLAGLPDTPQVGRLNRLAQSVQVTQCSDCMSRRHWQRISFGVFTRAGDFLSSENFLFRNC